ncbi:MAG TPA: TrkA family potassium uptake protein [Candidatus Baltobacteraceae bacterium]|nr:TrkA family potassium uptake protein [Candidatus Baltobacteraceae bacterium]
MHVIVVGCGDVGSQVATLLATEGNNVAVIDKNLAAFKRLGVTFNGLTINGYGFDEDVLQQAGIAGCEMFAAVTDQDNTNIMAAEVASKIYKVPRVVVRLFDAERENALLQLGLNYVCSTTAVAQMILDKLREGHTHHLSIRGDVELIEFIAAPEVDNKKVADLQIPNQFRICLVTRDGSHIIPWRETILKEGDVLLAIVKEQAHGKMQKYMRRA